MNKANLTAATALSALTLFPSFGIAASDPSNPDCPIVAGVQSLARKVDVFNGVCVETPEICGSLLEEINDDAQSFPGIIAEQNGPRIFFDPAVVFDTIDYYTTFPQVFDCDPEDPDCDGRTIDLRAIRNNIGRVGEGHEVFFSFPTSNIVEALQ